MVRQYIHRGLETKIARLAEKYPIITLLGPRQSGKTTLLQYLLPHVDYVTLESPDVRSAIRQDPRGFLDRHKSKSVIIDEFQRIPELVSYLQEYADSYYGMGQVYLTGSQQFNLMKDVSQSLAGRTSILRLLPLTLEELRQHYSFDEPEDVMVKGFYPAIYDRELESADWYPSYIETYLERDVRQLLQAGNLDKFVNFIKLLSGRAGQLANMNTISIEAGITQPTAKRWFSILKESQIVFSLQPYHSNINKRIVKTPKVYFVDTGLLCFLLDVHTKGHLSVHPLRSFIFENFVISEFYRSRFYTDGAMPELYFFRDKSGREVDLVIQHSGITHLLEIKYTRTVQKDHFRQLRYLERIMDIRFSSVLYAGGESPLPGVLSWADLLNCRGILTTA